MAFLNVESFLDAWHAFCGDMDCLNHSGGSDCGSSAIFYSSSCINHVAVVSVDVLLLLTFVLSFIGNLSTSRLQWPSLLSPGLSPLHLFSVVLNGFIGVAYLGLGTWIISSKMGSSVPLHQWLVLLFQGLTWLLMFPAVRTKSMTSSKMFRKFWLAITFSLGGFLCISSVMEIHRYGEVTIKIIIDCLCLPGGIVLLLCALKEYNGIGSSGTSNSSLHTPLIRESDNKTIDSRAHVTPLANAGFLSRLSFWWLNPLMKRGYKKPLEDKDIPHLREEDCAETRYNLFVEQLGRQKSKKTASPSIFWTIVNCHRTDIFVSGFCALLKILTLSSGPILLNKFIKFAEKKERSYTEGIVLAIALFLAKCLESVSQRQWYFRSRTLGLQVRSLLSAAIYRKQLNLSNSGRMAHSTGEIMNYVTVDAYRIGEFPFWFHQTWTTSLQLCLALGILYKVVGLATIAALVVIVVTVLCNSPLAKLQHKFQTKLMEAQDVRLKAMSEALLNMKVLKLYAWEKHFKNAIEGLREEELKWLSAFQLRKAYNSFLFWTSPVLVSAATFGTCYLLNIPLYASNVFTFVATLRLVQDPVRSIPDVIGVVIQAKVALTRIVKFLEAPELQTQCVRNKNMDGHEHAILITSASFSWDGNWAKPTLRNINLKVKRKDKVAICGEVGSGKSTLLAAILGEIPATLGEVKVRGTIAYVSQTAWIPTGTVRENILFGSAMDKQRYKETLEKCSLIKDLDMLPFGDLTEIGERGVNLSGGQKQRLQLARALYQDADIYLLDDPFSAVDAQTATSLFNHYVMDALSEKTVLLVTHQVDFLPSFNSVLVMLNGEILRAASYFELIDTIKEFQDLVNAHRNSVHSERLEKSAINDRKLHRNDAPAGQINCISIDKHQDNIEISNMNQLIKKEERETGDTGLKPYLQYLNQNKGYLYFVLGVISHALFIAGQISQNAWMAANVYNPQVSQLRLITVYLIIGLASTVFLFSRSVSVVILGLQSSKSLFCQLLNSLFCAPMSFFDSTPLGRILSRVSSDLSIVDLDVPFAFMFSLSATINAYSSLGVLACIAWQVLFVSIPMIYLTIQLQKYYLASGKELMRINGTTKSLVANHLAESASGTITIRAFAEEERFFAKNLELIDRNASPFFHNFSASEWLIQRLETMSAAVLFSAALIMALLPQGTFSSGFIGMALSYGLSLNMSLVFSIQNQCTLANYIISVERLNQHMHIPSEAPEVVEGNRPASEWPAIGKVEIEDLKVRYRSDSPLILKGISCTFEGGYKIGIVGRTGSGKTTLIGALFRLVEPAGGRILVDGLDITTIGLHDLRSRFAIIPQEPTLFKGTVRYNLDPLGQHADQDIWEVLEKCQLQEAVKEKEGGLDSLVTEDGSNWSLGQRQLFCLCRALLRRSRILVLDEATASIDNVTDLILQKTIRSEFAKSTVITVAHRIPTVMDCTMVLAVSDGKLVEFDRPEKLMQSEGSLFAKLVKEYWSHNG